MDANNEDQILVITGEQGEFFAIPWATVERHRATGEQQSEIEQLLGDDVAGYQAKLSAPRPSGPHPLSGPKPSMLTAMLVKTSRLTYGPHKS